MTSNEKLDVNVDERRVSDSHDQTLLRRAEDRATVEEERRSADQYALRRRIEDRMLEDHDRLIECAAEIKWLSQSFQKHDLDGATTAAVYQKFASETGSQIKTFFTWLKVLTAVNIIYLASAVFEMPLKDVLKLVAKVIL